MHVYADATISAAGLLGAWRGVEDFSGVSDVGGPGLNPRPTDYESVPPAEMRFDDVLWCVASNGGNPNGHNGIHRRI